MFSSLSFSFSLSLSAVFSSLSSLSLFSLLSSLSHSLSHRRRKSVATSVHGVQSLIVKPAQSFAPIAGVWILQWAGMTESSGSSSSSMHSSMHSSSGSSSSSSSSSSSGGGGSFDEEGQQRGVYLLTFGVPLICSVFQLWIWSSWELKDQKLEDVKKKVRMLM